MFAPNRRMFFVLLCAVFLAFSGCGSCDDTGAGTNNGSDAGEADTNGGDGDTECVDDDEDGFFDATECPGQVDCNDADASINPDAMETCGDQLDNDCNGTVDDGCASCTDGDTRDCGTDVGACEVGTQTCTGGEWGACEGGTAREAEVCDGVDNDCDGDTDEDPQAICDDGILCNGEEMCNAGSCEAGTPVDCSELDGACTIGKCAEKDGSCVQVLKDNGTTCDDGNFCTVDGVCQDGVCETSPRDCSGSGDQCNSGVCDEEADSCVPQPVSDGTTCDDGSFCTVGDSCTDGTCGGSARDCSAESDQCNDGVCDEQADSCVPQPIADGSACDDGQYCTTNDTCQQGTCTAGPARQCGAAGGSCRTGTCDEANDTCTGDPVADGTSCDDGSFCTVKDACQSGVCEPGPARDCSGSGDQCNNGVCDDSLNRCKAQPVADGTTCDDGRFCTITDVCTSGSCGGSSRDCSSESDQCNTGVCNEAADACEGRPVSDGTTCDDGLFCTVSDACTAGSCGGSDRPCGSLTDQCNEGICDENADACVADPFADGTSCDDGSYCTLSDACQSGSCTGGASRDCSALTDQCNTGVCDDSVDSCVADPLADGTTCDDGQYCTVNDSCQSGVCETDPRDCSAYESACEDGLCDEANDTCYSDQLPDGSSCDDGLSCTANDTCQGGVCGGSGSEPVADAGADQNVIPNTTVQLDGTGSSDPDGQSITYDWTISSKPTGSSATIGNPTSATPTFLADVAGTYEICLTVTDADGCQSTSDCVTVVVEPQADLLIELVWFSDDSDVDVHFRAPNGSYWDQDKNNCGAADQGTDVFYCVPNPDWGQGGEGFPDNDATNDPRLDVDNITGYGPENINQDVLFDTAAPERVAVHYFRDKGAGDGVNARIRIYVSGVLQFEDSRAMDCQDFWEVADIEVSNTGTTVSISKVNNMTTDTSRGFCP